MRCALHVVKHRKILLELYAVKVARTDLTGGKFEKIYLVRHEANTCNEVRDFQEYFLPEPTVACIRGNLNV